jgi:hypothetical protein
LTAIVTCHYFDDEYSRYGSGNDDFYDYQYYDYYHYYQNYDYHCGDDFDRGHDDQYDQYIDHTM